MPDEYDDEAGDESPVIRELRKKAKRADDLEPEVATLRQENAILKAGITDLTPAKQKALLAAHDGDLEPEALKRTAQELGFIPEDGAEASTPPEPQVPADEQAAHQRAAEVMADAEPADAHPESLEAKIRAAKSPSELDAILADAGMLGGATD